MVDVAGATAWAIGMLCSAFRICPYTTMSYDQPNYTQTPNTLFDEHLPEMGCSEMKVVLAVVRKTFGWHRKKQRLTTDDLMEITGLSNRGVIDGVEAAIERGVLSREKHDGSYRYWLNVEGREGCEQSSQSGEEGVSNPHNGCEQSSQGPVSDPHNASYNGERKRKKGKERKSSTPSEDGDSSPDPPEDEEEELPPRDQVEYEWTLEYARAAMQHLRNHDLLAPVTENKIDREGEDEVAVEWADTFRLIHEQDGYSPDEIQQTMEWLFEGANFWIDKAAIRSVPPLRSKTRQGDQYKFDSMYQSAKREGYVRSANGQGSEHPWPENPSEEWCRNNPQKNYERLLHHAKRA